MGLFSSIAKSVAGPLISAAGSFLGGEQRNSAQSEASAETQKFNAHQAKVNRNFQKNMSNTAHQREMRDLRRSGLNPILTGKYGGSTTPSGSAAAGVTPQILDTITPAINTGFQAYQTQSNVGLQSSQASLADANAILTQTQSKLSQALVPGAEAISTVTAELGKIANAVVGILNTSTQGYQDVLGEASAAVTKWLEKADSVGANTKEIIINVKNSITNLPGDVQEWFNDKLETYESQHQINLGN
jgi:hypothetical protein